MKTVVIVPSRLASTRLPEKPLAKLLDKEMIRWIYDALKENSRWDLYFAVDCQKLLNFCDEYKIPAIYTDPQLPSGTDRVSAAYRKIGKKYQFIINAQGDEPLIRAEYLSSFIDFVEKFDKRIFQRSIFTLAKEEKNIESFNNPAHVKAVCNDEGRALYFSRATVPYPREKSFDFTFLKHYGIYGYSPQALKKFVELKPGKLEMIEKLEQLRWLENGNDIFVQKVDFDLISIDTREDIETFENYIKKTLCN